MKSQQYLFHTAKPTFLSPRQKLQQEPHHRQPNQQPDAKRDAAIQTKRPYQHHHANHCQQREQHTHIYPFISLGQRSHLYALPALLDRKPMIQAQKIKHVAGPLPRIAIPMRVAAPKHLKALMGVAMCMMFFEGTGANPTTIKHHILPNCLDNILCLTPFLNTGHTLDMCRRSQSHRALTPFRDRAGVVTISSCGTTTRLKKRQPRRNTRQPIDQQAQRPKKVRPAQRDTTPYSVDGCQMASE